jgi:hypothetical protein
MALARIISHSHQCSRELALDLLARGYAVEIVAPDAIPDNLADLELRVEAEAANELAASLEAQGGARAVSLDFVHHLKAPMGDFVRRPPLASTTVSFPAQPVSFNAEPGVAEDVELPSENWRAPEPARPALGILPDLEESARPITPPKQFLTRARELAKQGGRDLTLRIHRSDPKQLLASAKELAKRVRQGVSIRLHRSDLEQLSASIKELAKRSRRDLTLKIHRPEPKQLLTSAKELAKHVKRDLTLRLHRSDETRVASSRARLWRPGLAFAAVVVLALVLGRGIRWDDAASANPASQVRPGKMAAPSEATLSTNGEPSHAAAPMVRPASAGKAEAKPAQVSNAPMTPRVNTDSKKSRAARSRRSEDDLIARDTVIYFDRSASVSRVKDSRRRASAQKQNGGHDPVRTVTDLR